MADQIVNQYSQLIAKEKRRITKPAEIVLWNEKNELAKIYAATKQLALTNEILAELEKCRDDDYYEKRIKSVFDTFHTSKKLNTKSGKATASTTKINWRKYIKDVYQPNIQSKAAPGYTERLRLAEDLSLALCENIPMYCDLLMMSSDHTLSRQFLYSSVNKIDHANTGCYSGNESSDLIHSCNCIAQCDPKTCACFKLQNEIFPEVKHLGKGIVIDNCDYTANGWGHCYSLNAVFMCGDKCSCNPEACPNHVRNIEVKGNGLKFEVFRRNQHVGFGVRTKSIVEMDQILMEFSGSLMASEYAGLDERRLSYALELLGDETISLIVKVIGDKLNIPMARWEVFNDDGETTKTNFYIEPYSIGNVGRYVAHGCTPNIAPIRVIANHLHPVKHRLFFKALFPIPAGSELFFDYGSGYGTNFRLVCGCGTVFCSNKENANEREKWQKLSKTAFIDATKSLFIHHPMKRIQEQRAAFEATEIDDNMPTNIQLRRPQIEDKEIAERNFKNLANSASQVLSKEAQKEEKFRQVFIQHFNSLKGTKHESLDDEKICELFIKAFKSKHKAKDVPEKWKDILLLTLSEGKPKPPDENLFVPQLNRDCILPTLSRYRNREEGYSCPGISKKKPRTDAILRNGEHERQPNRDQRAQGEWKREGRDETRNRSREQDAIGIEDNDMEEEREEIDDVVTLEDDEVEQHGEELDKEQSNGEENGEEMFHYEDCEYFEDE